MEETNNDGNFPSTNFQLELTKLYFGEYLEPSCKFMLSLIKQCNIPNISYEDCEDMYNEFFTIAVQTYNPERSKFPYFLKTIIRYQTLSFIRRVISHKDPLFFCSSTDMEFDNGAILNETLGEGDYYQHNFDSALASPELRRFSLTPLDKIILYYRGCGFTLKEIAQFLNVSLSSVRRRIILQRKNKKLLQGLAKLD